MPSRTTSLHGFTLEPRRTVPVAAVNPASLNRVIGALIRLDGRASSSADGAELTYAWSFVDVPLGSTVSELVDVEGDGSVVTFVPDVTGRYVVGLEVSTPYRTSAQVSATVDVTAVQVPLTLRTTPDGDLMFRVVSSFWKMVERSAVFSTVWSGYMQVVATDLLRAFQVDSNKSIATIQELAQRRWLDYAPALALDSSSIVGVFGYHQSGVGAFTASGSVATTGVIIRSQEIVLLDGAPSIDATGTTLVVYTSATDPGNTGEYLINRLNSDSSGYIVSSSTPFPSPTDERLHQGTTLVTFDAEREVYDSDSGVDFPDLDVEAGDVLRVEAGSDAGYYIIEAVGTVDGLANDRTLRLDRAPTQSASGRSYTVFNRVRIYARKQPAAATSTVYVPADEADFSLYAARTLAGSGTASSPYEIVVEARHVLSGMVGEKITITSGSSSGRSSTITGLNNSGTGYLVGSALALDSFPSTVSYSMTSSVDVSDRLLVLDDEAYEIVSAELTDGTEVEDGGRGPLWVVTLSTATAPLGREGMIWRVGGTLVTSEYKDLEQQGVTSGDLLVLEVVRLDTGFVGELPCYVLGASGNKIAFDFGRSLAEPGSAGSLSDEEVLALAEGLKIPRVYEDETGVVQVTLLAEELQAFLSSATFKSTYNNLPITKSTVFDLDGDYEVSVRVLKVVRNCRVPVDESLVTVPVLFEYIDTPQYGVDADGAVVLVGKYGETRALDREPLELIENRDYTLSSDSSTTGSNLQTTAGSSVLRIPAGSLIDRDLRVGDYVNVESGFDQGRYYVRSVLDDERVQAVTAEGVAPSNTASDLKYTLVRRTPGTFLRFVDGLFTPESPAPDRFWAQLSLFDNAQAIEDNFGVLVGVTKEQLDEYGSSQISYRGAVQALMFAWTNGPTVRNVTVGTHILMGLPVTEVRGRIVQIDHDYDTNGRGRVLVEDLDTAGNTTGIVRIYYFLDDASSGLSVFQGLAVNPDTGDEYAVLDEVRAFSPLSRGVIVSDYLTDPTWWRSGSTTGADELSKFHTWLVAVDAGQVDSRDMPLIYDFAVGIRPIYTKPKVQLVLYLYDEVEASAVLQIDWALFLADDPVLSVESTHMVDSYNDSSLPHRLLDLGSFSTRTLFEGADLVTIAGSGVVTSARGGFLGELDGDPLDHAPTEPVGTLPGVNGHFSAGVRYRGYSLVRPGDVLFVRDGPNRGRYTVVSVDSDTQLTVDELPDYPPTTRPADEIEAAEDQVFQVQRLDAAIICEGASASVIDTAGSGDDATTIVEDESGNFRWDGVAVGDDFLVLEGTDYGRYRILQVGVRETGDLVDRDTKLVLSGTLTEDPTSYRVEREQLRTNPILRITDLVMYDGRPEVDSAAGGFGLLGLPRGAVLRMLTGPAAGMEFEILAVPLDTELHLSEDMPDDATDVEAEIVIPGRFESGGTRDEDHELERLCALDEPKLVIVEPLDLMFSVTDLTLANDTSAPDPADWTATATSAGTNLEGSGVTSLTRVSIEGTSPNSGTRSILSADLFEVTISGLWREDETPVSASFYDPAPDWTVELSQVTLSGTMNLEFGPMTATDEPEASGVTFTNGSTTVAGVGTAFEGTVSVGDVVRLSGDDDLAWAVVLEIDSDTSLTLDRPYSGTGGTDALERGIPGGLVRPGDKLELDGLGTYTVRIVFAAEIVLVESTEVAVPASYSGRVTRAC